MTVKFRSKFLESRRVGLEYFLKSVSNPSLYLVMHHMDLFLTPLQLCSFEPGVFRIAYCQRFSLRSSLLTDHSLPMSDVSSMAGRLRLHFALLCIQVHILNFQHIFSIDSMKISSGVKASNTTMNVFFSTILLR